MSFYETLKGKARSFGRNIKTSGLAALVAGAAVLGGAKAADGAIINSFYDWVQEGTKYCYLGNNNDLTINKTTPTHKISFAFFKWSDTAKAYVSVGMANNDDSIKEYINGFCNRAYGGEFGLDVGEKPGDIAALVDWDDSGNFNTDTEWVGADNIWMWSGTQYVRADQGGIQYLPAYPATDFTTVIFPKANLTPEPATLGLMGLGLAGIATSACNSRRKRK